MGKNIAFKVTLVNHAKVYVLDIKVDSSFPAGEILDLLEDVFDEPIHATQIVRVERLSDPLYGEIHFFTREDKISKC